MQNNLKRKYFNYLTNWRDFKSYENMCMFQIEHFQIKHYDVTNKIVAVDENLNDPVVLLIFHMLNWNNFISRNL